MPDSQLFTFNGHRLHNVVLIWDISPTHKNLLTFEVFLMVNQLISFLMVGGKLGTSQDHLNSFLVATPIAYTCFLERRNELW